MSTRVTHRRPVPTWKISIRTVNIIFDSFACQKKMRNARSKNIHSENSSTVIWQSLSNIWRHTAFVLLYFTCELKPLEQFSRILIGDMRNKQKNWKTALFFSHQRVETLRCVWYEYAIHGNWENAVSPNLLILYRHILMRIPIDLFYFFHYWDLFIVVVCSRSNPKSIIDIRVGRKLIFHAVWKAFNALRIFSGF